MKLTAAQTRRIQHITNLVEKYEGASRISTGNMVYSVDVTESGAALLNFSNSDSLRWFDTFIYGNLIITPKGGIAWYTGSANPKLVLPATPRRCEYVNPYKKSK